MSIRLNQLPIAIVLGLTGLAACSSPELAQAKAKDCAPVRLTERSAAGLAQEVICVKSGKKVTAITVEIAASPIEQAKGLMFRTELAADRGMLFPFPTPKQASFWMKNTYIPLDIIYVKTDGSIESIAANAQPTSLTPLPSQGRVGAVLELAGGRAAELGLKAGDVVLRAP